MKSDAGQLTDYFDKYRLNVWKEFDALTPG